MSGSRTPFWTNMSRQGRGSSKKLTTAIDAINRAAEITPREFRDRFSAPQTQTKPRSLPLPAADAHLYVKTGRKTVHGVKPRVLVFRRRRRRDLNHEPHEPHERERSPAPRVDPDPPSAGSSSRSHRPRSLHSPFVWFVWFVVNKKRPRRPTIAHKRLDTRPDPCSSYVHVRADRSPLTSRPHSE